MQVVSSRELCIDNEKAREARRKFPAWQDRGDGLFVWHVWEGSEVRTQLRGEQTS